MKRGKKTILLMTGLIVLIGAYFGVQQFNQKQSVSESTGTYDLTARKTEDLTGLSWTMGETTMTFKLEDGSWTVTDDPAWPVDQDILQDLSETLISLQAAGKLENVSNPADYGLESPSVTATAVWTDGTSITYSMGDATPFEDGYYLSLSGKSDTIYIISTSLSNMFNKTQSQLVAKEEIPTVADVTDISVGKSFHAVRFAESLTVDPEQLWYEAETNMPLDGSEVEDWISQFNSIAWNEWVAANVEETALKDWHLDDAQAVSVALTGDDESIKSILLLGTQNENGDYYARLPNSSMVYTVKEKEARSLLSLSSDELMISAILPLPYDNLVSATMKTEKKTYTVTPSRQDLIGEDAAEETADAVSNEENEFISETDETEEAQMALWESLTALESVAENGDKEPGDQILEIHAVALNGVEMTVTFREYDANYYLAIADDKNAGLVSAAQVDAIVRQVNSKQ